MLYLFEDFALDTDRRELRRAGTIILIEPKAFDLLAYVIENRARVVTKDDLIASVWDGRIVSDSAMTTRLNAARSAIADSGGTQRLIKTLPRKGIRFVGVVREPGEVLESITAEPVAPSIRPRPPGQAVDRRASIHEYEWRRAAGLFRRRHHGRHHHRAVAVLGVVCHRP